MNLPAAIGAVAIGGAVGSVLRYFVSTWFLGKFGAGFPWGTFTINVSGAFVIGVVLELAATRLWRFARPRWSRAPSMWGC